MVKVKKRTIELHEGEPIMIPQVVGLPRLAFEQLVDMMADGGRVASTEVMATFTRLTSTLPQALARGNRVETPIGTFSVSIGVGERDESGGFALRPKNARVNFRPSSAVLESVRAGVSFIQDESVNSMRPSIDLVENPVTSEAVAAVHAHELVHLVGSNLDFNATSDADGVFFIGADGNEMRATAHDRPSPRQLIVLVPELAPGTYTLQVRALRSDDRMEVGQYRDPITVEVAG